MSGIKGMQDKAIKRLPKLATKLRRGFVSMDITWGIKTPTELDIVSALTCLINDLNPEKGFIRVATGGLFAEYRDDDGVKMIEFGMEVSDYVMKA